MKKKRKVNMKTTQYPANLKYEDLAASVTSFAIEGIKVNPEDYLKKDSLEAKYPLLDSEE